ncbi:MAG: fibrillarin-like rRNA/tRNA 2'-O-methyltransferase [Candidatus Micrarchaeia archaeon]
MHVVPHEKFAGVFWIEEKGKRFLATKNLIRGFRIHGERLVRAGGAEYRFWDPVRSKLAAAIVKGLQQLPIRAGTRVLYLGAASGVTASFVSDIIGEKGIVYCVELSPHSMRDFLLLCEPRKNMLPILADARRPERYAMDVKERVDVIYEDVADPEQARILLENARMFLKKGGHALIAIKSQSVDVTARPALVYERVLRQLSEDFEVLQRIPLEPFDREHLFVLLRQKQIK